MERACFGILKAGVAVYRTTYALQAYGLPYQQYK